MEERWQCDTHLPVCSAGPAEEEPPLAPASIPRFLWGHICCKNGRRAVLSPTHKPALAPHSFLIPPTSSSEHYRFVALLTPMAPASPALETDLIWDCYKNNNNPNAEKPQKGLRATHPSHPPSSPPFQTEYKTAPKADILYRGLGGLGSKREGRPWGRSVQVQVGDSPAVPMGPLGAQELCGCP